MTPDKPEREGEKSEEFQRFESLAQRLMEVPKSELDAAIKEDKKRKKRSRTSTKPAAASQ